MADSQNEKPLNSQESRCAMDPEIFAAQYRQAYPTLVLVAVGIIGDRTYAHDIVQEAAIIALEKLDTFTPGSNHVAWLSAIVRRCSLNYASKMRNRNTTAADPDVLAQTAEGKVSDSTKWPISGETGELVDSQAEFDDQTLAALREIKPEARCCLLLRVIQNLSYTEISELMQIPEGTAMSYVHRSKRQIRRSMEQQASGTETMKRKS